MGKLIQIIDSIFQKYYVLGSMEATDSSSLSFFKKKNECKQIEQLRFVMLVRYQYCTWRDAGFCTSEGRRNHL